MNLGRNTGYNLAGAFIPLVISLFTIPIYLKLIGGERYGVLAIIWLLLGYFGMLDLGMGRAVAQRIGSLRLSLCEDRATTFWTATIVNLGSGILGGLIIWPVALYVLSRTISLDAEIRPEMISILPWLTLMMPLATVSGVLSGALIGRERFLELNIISVLGAVLIQILPLIAVGLWGADLRVIIPTVLIARAILVYALLDRCRVHVFSGQRVKFQRAEALRLLKFGGWVAVSSAIGPFMVVLDRIIIGFISGAAAVTVYTVPFQLAERTTIPATAMSGAMFPRFSGLEEEERTKLADEGQVIIIVLMTCISMIAILMIGPFLSLWISPEFSQDASAAGIIILIGFWVISVAHIPYALIQARGRPDLVTKCHLIEILPYFAALYLGITYFGIAGAALAFLLRVAFDALALCWLAGQLYTTTKWLMVPSIIICSAVTISLSILPFSTLWILSAGTILSIALLWACITAPEKIQIRFWSLLQKLSPISRGQ